MAHGAWQGDDASACDWLHQRSGSCAAADDRGKLRLGDLEVAAWRREARQILEEALSSVFSGEGQLARSLSKTINFDASSRLSDASNDPQGRLAEPTTPMRPFRSWTAQRASAHLQHGRDEPSSARYSARRGSVQSEVEAEGVEAHVMPSPRSPSNMGGRPRCSDLDTIKDGCGQEVDGGRGSRRSSASSGGFLSPEMTICPPGYISAGADRIASGLSDDKRQQESTSSSTMSIVPIDAGARPSMHDSSSSRPLKLGIRRLSRDTLSRHIPDTFDRAPYLQVLAAFLVFHPRFDWVVATLILLSATSLGISADFVARKGVTEMPAPLVVTEKIFCAAFTFELALRLFVHRREFFTMSGRAWNVFDLVLVVLQLAEEVLSACSTQDFKLSGALRLLRLIRVVRLARLLRLIRELRVLVSSITSSLKALVWTVLLMFLIIYAVSLCLTQVVSEYRASLPEGVPRNPELEVYFGSVGRCMLSLFQAVTGGMDWDDLVSPLLQEVSMLASILFIMYIAIAMLAIMNVVTGVLVDSVLASAKTDKEQFLLNNAKGLFKTSDEEMDWDAFQNKMTSPQMLEFFRGIDVDPSEAKGIFSLIDADESGSISADEFLNSCVRLQGPAKALEVAVLVQEVRRLRRGVGRLELSASAPL